MSLRIARLHPDDWQLYRDVRLAALLDAPDAFASRHADQTDFTESDWRVGLAIPCWVAFTGDEPVGMVRVGDIDAEHPTLISMWVAPSARGTRAASDLVGAVVDWARNSDKAGLELDVVTRNERAIAFYRRLGFVPDGRTATLPDGRNEIRMVRSL